MTYRLNRTFWAALSAMAVLALLSACGGNNRPPLAVQPSPEQLASKQLQARQAKRKAAVAELLAKAEQALARDHLTTPVTDNALDRYRAVLLLAPNSKAARSGIDRVARRYCQLAHTAIQAGNLARAQRWLQQAERVSPRLVAIAPLQRQLDEARSRARQQPAARVRPPVNLAQQDDVVPLPRQELRARSDRLVAALAELAQQVKAEDAYVLIVTPSDADGRWVYQQMKRVLPGYRLRGNIELGREPKIVLQPPL